MQVNVFSFQNQRIGYYILALNKMQIINTYFKGLIYDLLARWRFPTTISWKFPRWTFNWTSSQNPNLNIKIPYFRFLPCFYHSSSPSCNIRFSYLYIHIFKLNGMDANIKSLFKLNLIVF